MIEIRPEELSDRNGIRSLNEQAFEGGPEAVIVDKLRETCEDYISFVAVEGDLILGHILFTPVTVDDEDLIGMGLAPMAVTPSRQGQGIGTRLVEHGLKLLRKSGCPFVIVLGHPEYYPRFGFEPASKYRLLSQWDDVPEEAFMVTVFKQDDIPMKEWVVRYRPEFDQAV